MADSEYTTDRARKAGASAEAKSYDNIFHAFATAERDTFIARGFCQKQFNSSKIFRIYMRKVRGFTHAPIHILASRVTTQENTDALLLGANQFIQRESDSEENIKRELAYIQNLNDFCRHIGKPSDYILYYTMFLFPEQRKAFVNDEELPLTQTEFDLLHLLLVNRKRVLTLDLISDHIKGSDKNDDPEGAVRAHIKRLRKKLDIKSGEAGYMKNVQDSGYIIE